MFFKFLRKNYYRFIIGIMRRFNICSIRKTKYGIKGLNNWYGRPCKLSNEPIYISCNDLFLEKDFLKNEFTLLDTNICKSPHFELMDALMSNKDVRKTDYIKRFESGYLDGRFPSYVSNKDIKIMGELFNKRLYEIKNDEYDPVLVYSSNGRYYIYDGKHRAALCALLNKDVKCMLIKEINLSDSVIFEKYKIIKNDSRYSKTIYFLENL